MDVDGPIERSRLGNGFMLVITDYSTRYQEVMGPIMLLRETWEGEPQWG